MRGKICFMMLGVMVAVSTGFSFDISAYGYASPLQKAYMEEQPLMLDSEASIYDASLVLDSEHIQKAAEEVENELEKLEEAKAAEAAAQQTSTYAPMSERDLMARLVMAEAGGEDLQGQIMVANVVLNRYRCGYSGSSSISDVINAPGQFEPVSTGRIWSLSPSASVYEAVDRALAGEDYSNGALYFVSAHCDASWFESDLTRVAEHGGHVFYK